MQELITVGDVNELLWALHEQLPQGLPEWKYRRKVKWHIIYVIQKTVEVQLVPSARNTENSDTHHNVLDEDDDYQLVQVAFAFATERSAGQLKVGERLSYDALQRRLS